MAKCKACGKEILFVRTPKGKYIPVDPDRVPYKLGVGGGTVVTSNGEVIRGVGEPFGPEPADGWGYIPHWATCPYAEELRRQK